MSVEDKLDISKLNEKEKRDLLLSLRRLSGNKKTSQRKKVPTTDDELWWLIKEEIGDEIPRVAVCEDHDAPFDFVADYFFERKRAILVMANREGGKCLVGNSLVYDPVTGLNTEIEDIIDNSYVTHVVTMDKDGNIKPISIDGKYFMGEKECLKIKTISGRSIEVTPEHPFMCQDGWKRADEIEIGEAIAIPSFIPFHSNQKSIPDSHVVILAALLSEGGISNKKGSLTVTSSDDDFLNLVKAAADDMECDLNYRSRYDYGICKRKGNGKYNPVKEMLNYYDVEFSLAKNKIIPDIIFELNKNQLCKFLSIFWMGDGYILDKSVAITLASKKMIENLQHLLLKIKIQSRIRYKQSKYKDKYFDAWELTIYGNHFQTFLDNIDLWGYKLEKLEDLCEKTRCPSAGRPPLTDAMMQMFKEKVPIRKRGMAGKRVRESYEQLGWSSDSGFGVSVLKKDKVKNLQSRRLEALCHAHYLDKNEFSILLNKDIWWDFIIDIESVGVKRVYDLTVIPTESFIANDIIVHNTRSVNIANYLNCEYKPGCEVCVLADIEAQSNKSYNYVKSFVYIKNSEGKKTPKSSIDGDPLRKETIWKNGSKLEVIIASKSGVNSPHPHKVHADEIDLMDREIWGEAQPHDMDIYTPRGLKRFGDLKIGDYVFGSDGFPTKVIKINELGYKEIFRIELTDGRNTECCKDHLWLLGGHSGDKKTWCIYRVSDILKDYKKNDPRWNNGWIYKYRVPQQESVYYPPKGLPLHPYILGFLLGDGCFRQTTLSFRTEDKDIANRIQDLLPDEVEVNDIRAKNEKYARYSISVKGSRKPNPVMDVIKRLELFGENSHSKFIPLNYLESSEMDRIELVRGLMDSDGSFTKDPYYITVSEDLAICFKELIMSLGGRALFRKKKAGKTGFSRTNSYIYEVSASLPNEINPFWCERKSRKFKNRLRTLEPSIKSIIPIGKKRVRCIGVKANDGLYLTSEFIVTHNSRSMASSGKGTDGTMIKSQDIATSTRKSTKGLVQEIIDESDKAIKLGVEPPWHVVKFCIFESAKEVACCSESPTDKREARLKELGKDPKEICKCDKVLKGEWATGVPRTLKSVCKGKLFKSRGWMGYDDIIHKFTQNTPMVWVAQHECRRPMADGLYLPTWSRERYCLYNYSPRPEYGLIWQSVDWGGIESSFVVWIQGPLHHSIEVNNTIGSSMVIPQGAYVAFNEISEAQMGATRLADKVVRQEIQYKNQFPGWRVKARFADMAGRQQREDWREHNPPLRTVWYISRDVEPQIECIQDLVTDHMLYVAVDKCPNLADDFESWRQKDGREIHDSSCLIGDTLITTNRGAIPIKDVLIGDEVYTRNGLRRVSWSGQTGIRELKRVEFSDGRSLVGTFNHPVWVEGKGWTEIALLRPSDIIDACDDKFILNEKQLSTVESRGIDGLNLTSGVQKHIIMGPLMVKQIHIIDSFMKIISDQFRKVMRFTIKISTIIIIQSTILNLLRKERTQGFIGWPMKEGHIQLIIKKRFLEGLKEPRILQRQKEQDLLVAKHHGHKNQFSKRVAIFVKKNIQPRWKTPNFVLKSVKVFGIDIMEKFMTIRRKEFANSVKKSLRYGNIEQQKLVPIHVSRVSDVCEVKRNGLKSLKKSIVYDLTIEGDHEFYANGILVHNSHGPAASRYLLKNATTIVKRYKRDVEVADPVVVAREELVSSPVAISAVSSNDGGFTSDNFRRTMLGPFEGDREREPWQP
jgi:intein/homing endonuclease